MKTGPGRVSAVSETSDRYGIVAAGFSTRLAGVAPDMWSAPTPCPDWTVRDLVAHAIDTHRRVAARLDSSDPVEVDRAGDLELQWRAASDSIALALGDETQASTVMGGMFGEQPFEALVGRLVCTDLLVHTWDLARATGQDEELDPGALARATVFLAAVDDAIRVRGGFGPKIAPAADADEQTRFLNFCGRAV